MSFVAGVHCYQATQHTLLRPGEGVQVDGVRSLSPGPRQQDDDMAVRLLRPIAATQEEQDRSAPVRLVKLDRGRLAPPTATHQVSKGSSGNAEWSMFTLCQELHVELNSMDLQRLI